jgi:hypothetical protein
MKTLLHIERQEAVELPNVCETRGIPAGSMPGVRLVKDGAWLEAVRHFDTGLGQFSASDRFDMTCRYFALDLRRAAMVQQ